MHKNILLITPPFTQLNTPYPATAYLKGFLNTKDIESFQMDLGIEVIIEMFSSSGLKNIFEAAVKNPTYRDANTDRILSLKSAYIGLIDEVVAFLQGKRPTFARAICSGDTLPQASRFDQLEEMEWAFGAIGIQDRAKHLATLFLEDLADFIRLRVDENFGFSRYAERVGRSANSFDELHEKLLGQASYVDEISLRILDQTIKTQQPKLVCFSVPFPGNLYSAFKCAQYLKQYYPEIKVAMGGGFPNTELRSLSDPRVFHYFDYITLDDGELPIEILISNVLNPTPSNPDFNFFKRTFLMQKQEVEYNNFSLRSDYKQHELGTPDYSDLLLDQYISVIEVANPMHSLWTDGRWNKLTMAHGCYWGKCTFCDISLDYIKNYEPIAASLLVDRMEELIAQTGETGFHFVDEAAPPSLMQSLALEILRRNLRVSWWTNIRFEKRFSLDLCRLLQASGCIAVSGGLEVASNRLLELIDKGITVEQVVRVANNLTSAGIMVHAYLMYGYPTQTDQETVDSLEYVRQMFDQGILNSAFWHQFSMTSHSPVGLNPEAYGVIPLKEEISFADNDVAFIDSTGIDHEKFSFGLKKSLFNFMHGMCFDFELDEWFDFEIPKSTVDKNFIDQAIQNDSQQFVIKPSAKLVWLAHHTLKLYDDENAALIISNMRDTIELKFERELAIWLNDQLSSFSDFGTIKTFGEFQAGYNIHFDDFLLFWYGDVMSPLKDMGLLVL